MRDITLSEQLDKAGYTVIDFCSAEQLSAISELYASVPNDKNSPFWSSSFLDDTEFKNQISSQVSKVLQESVGAYLSNHTPLGVSYLVKSPGEYSVMPIHQDWTVTDESEFGSYTIWIPLKGTASINGALQVIEGSHKLNSQLRSPSLPVAFEQIDSQLRPYLKTVELKAGQAIVFNHALMHASPPNLSNEERVAVTYGFVAPDAQLFMYYGVGNDKVAQYKMPDDMFIKYPEIRTEPKIGKLEKEFDYTVKTMMMSEVENEIGLPKSDMVPLFKDEVLQTSFEKNGFVKIPALNQEDIDALLNLHQELDLKDEKGYGFHVGMDNADKNLVSNMVNKIKEVAMPKVEDALTGAQVFTASFVLKEPNPQGVVPPHQDWSFVEDEKKHCSVTCWIPLQDVNMENGCIGVIKGSNRFFTNVRPSPSPQVETPLKRHMYTIFPYLELQEMKAGEALIFDNRIFHASPPNTTDSTRIAVGLGFTQAEAEIRHYYLKPGTEDTLLKYKIDPGFFLKYDNLGLSKMYDKGENIEGYELIEEMPYEWEDLSEDEMRKLMESAGNKFNAPLVETMTKLFVQAPPPEEREEQSETQPEPVVETSSESNDANAGDDRSFWQTYTPMNIIKEVKFRLTGKA